ncbi:LuxR C-terminal-related transcriptional regulator [Rhizomonospora bruguierae]|uniref:LuxR C-terminal-related transcriptional regulator n=1 Tax=Rhizomonospora bruguierae TaxID=1581705 RepID=UPI001BD0418F|nr:LuxR C-terminal-related transcriptional regulator [Micromonospora sp. NBRC 107566]
MGEISAREAEVLAAVGEHLTNAQIAGRLHISARTVESHVSALLRKCGASDRRQLAALAAEAAELGARADDAVLPEARTSFVGRAEELEVVRTALGTSRLVSLTGPGGVGKTRLAVTAAAAVAPRFPVGVVYLDLVPVPPGQVVAAAANALGVTERPPRPLLDSVADRVRGRAMLLVLDNCEHVLDEVGGLVEALLRAGGRLRILATSRERLGVTGEESHPVPPLPLGSAAETLFLDRAAVLATARAWQAGADPAAAIEAAHDAGDPTLLQGALDSANSAAARQGRLREAYRIARERLDLLPMLTKHRPADGIEMFDLFHSVSLCALAVGDLPGALATAARATEQDPVNGDYPFVSLLKYLAPLTLSGRFDEAIELGERAFAEWRAAGAPLLAWLAPSVQVLELATGLRGDHGLWRARTLEFAGHTDPRPWRLAATTAFVEARLAIHTGHLTNADRLVRNAFQEFTPPWYRAYANAAGAELAVLAHLPDAGRRLEQAEHTAEENDWAAACVARARGRFTSDAAAFRGPWRSPRPGHRCGHPQRHGQVPQQPMTPTHQRRPPPPPASARRAALPERGALSTSWGMPWPIAVGG